MEEPNLDFVEKMDQKRLSGDNLRKTSRLRQEVLEYESSLLLRAPVSNQEDAIQEEWSRVRNMCDASREGGTAQSKVKA